MSFYLISRSLTVVCYLFLGIRLICGLGEGGLRSVGDTIFLEISQYQGSKCFACMCVVGFIITGVLIDATGNLELFCLVIILQ